MIELLRMRFVLPALVVPALALLGVLAWITCPGATRPAMSVPKQAPVTTATRICPVPAGGGTRIAVFSASSATSAASQSSKSRASTSAATTSAGHQAGPNGGQNPGAAQLTALGAPVPPLLQAAQPGQLFLDSGGHVGGNGNQARAAAQAPVAVRAAGAMARGAEVEETSGPPGGSGPLTGIRCPEPGTDFWFAAPGQAVVGSLQLYLINPDSQPASADVDIDTDSGPLQGTSDTAITVPPGGSLTQAVDKLTGGSQAVALHVRTTAGRVVAALKAGGGSGSWLPPAGEPATSQMIAGNPPSGNSRTLYLSDPGSSDAQVSLQAVTPTGTYQPTGGASVDVPSGSAVSVSLPAMSSVPGAIRVKANVPVAASLMAAGGNNAYTSATAPITQQSVAADNMADNGYATTVELSAPGAAARVALSTATTAAPAGGQGKPAEQVVSVPAGHTTAAKVTAPNGGTSGFAIVATPLRGSGPVYAARVLTGPGGNQTILPMVTAPASVAGPGAADSLTAVIP
jgi:hypothetical protein